ncbi:MAG: hypothetical protein UW69_C0002G0018 [Microgenomates group bacterium GW2011_GWA2_44_7]|uniref:Type IV pilus assembly protein PilO n=1 Tax=Candidatus Woesebacteria bacterium GW2011_GWA1_43_12 TaxID=1618557 RepID=A0A0G1CX87_9BACT|nr:MAG: hypothetical protein UV66_C0004G0017 [Candidatus Woesebacteria bacterium GW2011_GWA1_43_12]KKT76260.1 MAG: hypothetical protein UW69_C0002G0018 [Microgenomates group bacterium GW2011_GWA2_44_7]KKT77734.1 MAG: hypothetical protein UW73_C0013G0017 [Microgenomates group bacterium GW2011_GWB1_44_8]
MTNLARNRLGPWHGFIVPLVVVLSILLSLFLIVTPAFESIKKTNKEVEEQQKKLDFLTQKVEDLKKLDPEVVDRRLGLMEKAIPSEKDALAGVALLQTVASTVGVNIENLSVSPGMVSSDSAALQADMSKLSVAYKGVLVGDIDQFLAFFDTLAKPTFPLFVPTKINFSGSSDKRQTGTLTLNMLWLQQPKSFGGDSKPVANLSTAEEDFVRWVEQNTENAPSGLMPIDQSSFATVSGKTNLF